MPHRCASGYCEFGAHLLRPSPDAPLSLFLSVPLMGHAARKFGPSDALWRGSSSLPTKPWAAFPPPVPGLLSLLLTLASQTLLSIGPILCYEKKKDLKHILAAKKPFFQLKLQSPPKMRCLFIERRGRSGGSQEAEPELEFRARDIYLYPWLWGQRP